MRPGVAGRFLSLDLEGSGELRAGRLTEAGEALDIPQVQPVLSYALLVAHLVVFASSVNILVTQGPESAADFAAGLSVSAGGLGAGEWWRLGSALLLHGGPAHLAVDALVLAVLAPQCEALLGYGSFAALYVLSGVTGAVVAGFAGCDAAAGGSWGGAGMTAALLVYAARNQQFGVVGTPTVGLALALLAAAACVQPDGILPALGAAFAAGLWLGSSIGPRLATLTEVDIPEGSMAIPENAQELNVVVDQTSVLTRATALATYALLLAAAAALASAMATQ